MKTLLALGFGLFCAWGAAAQDQFPSRTITLSNAGAAPQTRRFPRENATTRVSRLSRVVDTRRRAPSTARAHRTRVTPCAIRFSADSPRSARSRSQALR